MGDMIEKALSSVGITEERVKKYVWCRCKQRKQRFNEVHQWAEGVVKGLWGSVVEAKKHIEDVLAKEEKV